MTFPSPTADWARFVLTFGVLALNAATLAGLYYVALTTRDATTASNVWPIVNMMVGGVLAWGGGAINYWLGTNHSSDRKTELLGEAAKP